tara:strand:- start:254 stop:1216 length:963 start_codon:yes stop_codon:yes gene_type:complete
MNKTNCLKCNKLYSTKTIIKYNGYCNKCDIKRYNELLKKYNELSEENYKLSEENYKLFEENNKKNTFIKNISKEYNIFIEGDNINDGHCDIYNLDGNISYIGDIKNGEYHGFGKKYNIFGDIEFDGYFEKGNYVKGILYYNDGSIKYKGTFKNNIINGVGTYYFKNNGILKMMGITDVKYNNGEFYKGMFKDGQMSGFGEYYNKDNIIIYKGEWNKNMRNGNGKIFNDKKELIYSGEILNDKINGEGIYYYNNKIMYEGDFKNNKIINKEYCKICYKNIQNILFIPCGHLCMCESCSIKYLGNNCIICCETYSNKQKVYY